MRLKKPADEFHFSAELNGVINLFRLPDIYNYKPESSYYLPFTERWAAANGGITEETSHSWNVCNQRYAYDFYIQENDSTIAHIKKDSFYVKAGQKVCRDGKGRYLPGGPV